MTTMTRIAELGLLTAEGLVRCRLAGDGNRDEVLALDLEGENIREVCRDPFNLQRLYAASITDIYRSEDGGEHWRQLASGGIDYREIWTMAVHPTRPDELYVGTLPAAVYVSEDGGLSFRELSGLRQLPDYDKWTFPPPPHTAHIRSIVLDARVPDEIVVGIEEGGIARSTDRGLHWEDISGTSAEGAFPKRKDLTGQTPYEPGSPQEGRVYRDVHMVVRHPVALDRLYASTGMGTYRTDDAGQSWRQLGGDGLQRYSVPMAVHPDAPDRIFLGTAENSPPAWKGHRGTRSGPFNVSRYGVDLTERLGGAQSNVLRSDDGGATWKVLDNGLPVSSPAMVCTLAIHPLHSSIVFAAYTDGAVYASSDGGDSWQKMGVSHPKLHGLRILSAEG